MRRSPFAIILSGITTLLIVYSCNILTVPEPDRDNPYDQENPDYTTPTATITSGPEDGGTVHSSEIDITWEGNEIAAEYSYRLNDGDWTGWSAQQSTSLEYLNEEQYQFQLRARADDAEKTVGDTTEIAFTVDAVDGPSLMIYPRYYSFLHTRQGTIQLRGEEISNVMGIEAIIQYDAENITIQTVDSGTLMTSNNGENIFFWEDHPDNGILEIVAVKAGGSAPTVGGSGVIATVQFSGMPGETEVVFTDSSVFMDATGDPIAIHSTVGGRIQIR